MENIRDRSLALNGARLAFVSYAREDWQRASQIKRSLEARGIRTWIDNQELHHRDNEILVAARIWDALGAATDFVMVASPGAIDKPWVRHELQIASERWISAGSPKVWLVTHPGEPQLPEIPYSGLFSWTDDVGDVIAQRIGASDPNFDIDDTTGKTRVLALRSQYLMGGSTAVQAINLFDALFPQIKAKIDHAVREDFVGAGIAMIDWIRALSKFLDLRADQEWLCNVLRSASAVPGSSRPIILNNLGTALVYRGEFTEAVHCIDETTALWEAVGDWTGVAISLGNRALLALEEGQLSRVFGWCERADAALDRAAADGALMDPASKLELLVTRGNIANHRGRALARTGRWQSAFQAFADHLALATAIEDRRGIAAALGRIAWLDLQQHQPSVRTQATLDRYLTMSVAATNPRGVAFARTWRGQLAVLSGAFEVAANEFRAEALLREHLASPLGSFRANAWAALCFGRLGRTSEAEPLRARAVKAVEGAALDAVDRELLFALHGRLEPHKSAAPHRRHPALRALLV